MNGYVRLKPLDTYIYGSVQYIGMINGEPMWVLHNSDNGGGIKRFKESELAEELIRLRAEVYP